MMTTPALLLSLARLLLSISIDASKKHDRPGGVVTGERAS